MNALMSKVFGFFSSPFNPNARVATINLQPALLPCLAPIVAITEGNRDSITGALQYHNNGKFLMDDIMIINAAGVYAAKEGALANSSNAESNNPDHKRLYQALFDVLSSYKSLTAMPVDMASAYSVAKQNLAESFGTMVRLAEKNANTLSADDHSLVNKEITNYLGIRINERFKLYNAPAEHTHPDKSFGRDITALLGRTDALPALFKMVHRYGLEKQFDEVCREGFVHKKIIRAYDGWKTQNKKWIETKGWLNQTVSKVVPASAPPAPNPYRMAIVASAPAVTPAPKLSAPAVAVASPVVANPAGPKERRKGSKFAGWDLSTPERSVVVEVKPKVEVVDIDTIPMEVLELMTAPAVPAEKIAEAVEENSSVIAEGQDAILEEVAPVAEDQAGITRVKTRLNIVRSHGDACDNVGRHNRGQVSKYKSGEDEHPSHDRQGILEKALGGDTRVALDSYGDDVDPNAATKTYPYGVINVLTENEYAQIFVCNYHGFATFVCRDTECFDPDTEIDINALRDDPKVWMVPFHNEEQFVSEIKERLFTPVDQMDVQNKRPHFWTNSGECLRDTFKRHVVQTGRVPCRDDDNNINFGAFRSTWCAAFAAARRDTIKGYEGIKSPAAFFARVCEDTPGLSEFKGAQPLRIQAAEIHEALTDGSIHGKWKPGVLSLAFEYGAVENLIDYIPEGHQLPRSLEKFAEIAGQELPSMVVADNTQLILEHLNHGS